jgi:hypothetical protein
VTANGTAHPVSHTNPKGQVHYLHAGKTKTSKRRYFVAKSWSWALDRGALDRLLPKYLNKLGTSAFFELY